MSRSEFDIHDDDLRVIGQKGAARTSGSRPVLRKPMLWVLLLLVILGVVAACFWMSLREEAPSDSAPEDVVFEPMGEVGDSQDAEEAVLPLGDYSDSTLTKPYTEHLRDTINDIPLDIYIPHNAVPELVLGVPDIHDKSIVLTTQAADIRADNGKIVGAFVLKGKPLSWGLSKRGYCGIIDGNITVGVADNSPMFEEATEKGGYFFRQYPLVDNGVLVENEPKGKSVRKALCDRYDHLAIIYNKFRYGYRYENFIVWR